MVEGDWSSGAVAGVNRRLEWRCCCCDLCCAIRVSVTDGLVVCTGVDLSRGSDVLNEFWLCRTLQFFVRFDCVFAGFRWIVGCLYVSVLLWITGFCSYFSVPKDCVCRFWFIVLDLFLGFVEERHKICAFGLGWNGNKYGCSWIDADEMSLWAVFGLAQTPVTWILLDKLK